MGLNEDVRDLSKGDCDASHWGRFPWALLIIAKSYNFNLTSMFLESLFLPGNDGLKLILITRTIDKTIFEICMEVSQITE